jgi:Trk K+ transport system NAD-binding subunit
MALHLELKKQHGAVLVAVDQQDGATLTNPPGDLTVRAGDRLVVISRQPVKL